ncbi:MAG: cyclic GMP-AMP synthase DncV-like nucleotidyltransferase [Gammaproteobacteria bacterium]
MPKIDCNNEVRKYHSEEVTLSNIDQKMMRERRNAGRTRLNTGLKRDGRPLPCEQESQGSYAMRTMIQDPQSDYDIDDGAYFDKDDLKNANGGYLTPAEARQRVCDALKQDDRLKHDPIVKPNCVRQPYPEGYHIDIPVYRRIRPKDSAGNDVIEFEHASGDEWVRSDARAVTRWYNGRVGELKAGETDSSQLRRITKLTKKSARRRMEWKSKTTSGICMTKLVVDHFVAKEGRDDKSLHETWKAIRRKLDLSLQVAHPVLAGKNLAETENPEVEFFKEKLIEALKDLEVLDAQDCTRAKARAAWDKVFNTTFFSDQPTEDEAEPAKKSAAPFVVTSADVARRDDGGRRFG